MLVDEGLKELLDAQRSYLNTCTFRLYTTNVAILSTTVLSDLGAEAGWAGYGGPIAASPWQTVNIVDPRSTSLLGTLPTFGNTSGVSQTFWVVALVNPSNTILIDAVNIGLTTIINGGSYTFAALMTDKEE